MTKEQVHKLIEEGQFPEITGSRKLVETHISWVILCDHYVYKIKKPIRYSFLDFSTIERRKYFCEKEVMLNRRLSGDMYIGVEPIICSNDDFTIGHDGADIIDYAVKMKKLDLDKQMDILLSKGLVTAADIQRLAKKIASFHQQTAIIEKKDILNIQNDFNDLAIHKAYIRENAGIGGDKIIDRAVNVSDKFIRKNAELLYQRVKNGYCRDCHGDLHSKNIFLLPEPVPFDCIEFNDDLRQIDVLNEVAFLCMDLDACGRQDLSDLFIESYNKSFVAIANENERSLFVYSKGYRANVRAKVNILRAKSATNDAEREAALAAAGKYLLLMEQYLQSPEFLQ